MAKYIERGTNYAYTIERIKDITFTKLRSVAIDFTRRLPSDLSSELYESIQHGVCQLQSEPELNMYLHALGLMHEAKLQHAFEHLPDNFINSPTIEIIDYGCGQAIGTICYADFLRKNNRAQKVRKITLIEPSEMALKRAALHTSCFFPNAEIITINKGFDDLVADDICTDDNIPTLHIFSNVIDLADDYFDLKNFADLINNNAQGENHYICIEPYFDYNEQDEKLKRFTTIVAAQPYYSNVFQKGSFVEGREWTCNIAMLKIGSAMDQNYTKDIKEQNDIKTSTIKLSNYLNIIRELIRNGGKRRNAIRINNVDYTEKGHFTEVALTITSPIACYVSDNNGLNYKLSTTNVIFSSLQVIIDTIKEDEDLSWLCNVLSNNPTLLSPILNGGFVDIIQQEIPANTQFSNPFGSSSNPNVKICGHNIILNHCIKFKLSKKGKNMATMVLKATEQNDTSAQNSLGCCYYSGEGVEQDYTEAIKWFRKAAERGDANAQFNLGVCYANGQGVEQGQTEAVKWYHKAAKQGHKPAQEALVKLKSSF